MPLMLYQFTFAQNRPKSDISRALVLLSFNSLTNYFANIKFEQVRLLRSNQFVIWPYLHSRPGKQIVHLVLTGKSQTLDQQGDRKYTLFCSKTESVESSYV